MNAEVSKQQYFKFVSAINSRLSPLSDAMRKFVYFSDYYGVQVTHKDAQRNLSLCDDFQWHQYYGFDDEVLGILLKLAKDSPVICDIGANIGFYSIAMAQQVPSARVLAFEPNPRTHKLLTNHVNLNEVENIDVVPIAAGDKDDTWTWRIYDEDEVLDVSGVSNDIAVPVRRVDDEIKSRGIDLKDVGLIKIDVEGFELEVLLGLEEIIRTSKPYICFESIFSCYVERPQKRDLAFDLLKQAGYLLYHIVPYSGNKSHIVSLSWQDLDKFFASSAQYNLLAWNQDHQQIHKIFPSFYVD